MERASELTGTYRVLARWPLFGALSPEALDALERSAVERVFRPGALLLEAGSRADLLHVVDEGLVREFYVNADGKEHTRAFIAGGSVTGSLLDLASGAPSVTWIQALEQTRTLAIRFSDFNALAARYGELESLARQQAEALAVRKTKREYEMLALSARERLELWRAEFPALDGRITRRMLASFLGISAVHLSRISSRGQSANREARQERARPPS